jgi:hypothetical protein
LHRSGIGDWETEPFVWVETLASRFAMNANQPLWAPAGAIHNYGNRGYTLAGLLAAEVQGTSFADAVAMQVLEPLGMMDAAEVVSRHPPRDRSALVGPRRANFLAMRVAVASAGPRVLILSAEEVAESWATACNGGAPRPMGAAMQSLVHLVAHTRGGWSEVVRWESANWLWRHLRDTFATAMAAALMPDHLHLATLLYAHTIDALRRLLQHHSRMFGCAWDLGPPTPIHTRQILGRTARYIWLNPPRARLVDDPLVWPWTTLRDAIGATAEPWGGPDTIGRALEMTPSRIHLFATEGGTALAPLVVLRPHEGLAVNLTSLVEACASALRCHRDDLTRRRSPMRPLFVDLAYRVAAPRPRDLADACRVSLRALSGLRGRAPAPHLRAALLCLGDHRLRTWSVQPPLTSTPRK